MIAHIAICEFRKPLYINSIIVCSYVWNYFVTYLQVVFIEEEHPSIFSVHLNFETMLRNEMSLLACMWHAYEEKLLAYKM